MRQILMDEGFEKIAGFILALVFIGAILLYIGNNLPEGMQEPFINIGNIALFGSIALIILIIIVVFLLIYSKAR